MPETALTFECQADTLVGVLHEPPASAGRFGVVIVVGGPQYRVGSHRQFVLLARALASAGVPCLRFDYRGQGDSAGEYRGFESCGPDIRAAVDVMMARRPELESIVLWGLCDAASAILMYAPEDARIGGLVLLNPWVRSEAGHSEAMVQHYYARRILDPGFWRKLLTGGVSPLASLRELLGHVRRARGGGPPARSFQERMLEGAERFRGPVLLVTSGDDLTAAEFLQLVARDPRWARALAPERVARHHLQEANHTFSRAQWRGQVERWTIEWLRGL